MANSSSAKLTHAVIQEGRLEIGSSAFNGCSSLTSIVIPASAKETARRHGPSGGD